MKLSLFCKPLLLWMIFDGVVKHQAVAFNLSRFYVFLYLVPSLIFLAASIADETFDHMYRPVYVTNFNLITDMAAVIIFAAEAHFVYAGLMVVAAFTAALPYTDKKEQALAGKVAPQ